MFDILKCKIGDTIALSAILETPFDKIIDIMDLNDVAVLSDIQPDFDRSGNLYWSITIDSVNFTEKTYYKAMIYDPDLTGETEEEVIFYVTDEKNFEDMLLRSQGLAGKNVRFFSYTWTRGQLTQFDIKLYSTAAAVTTADEGGADAFFAHYRVTITYDTKYNPTLVQSVRIS